eukprot:CAMPEP_0183318554 /NCGR_PEP_ID=MMETSP0160_2-20130417/61057_1 /TAXON_ID=2839 ORGANISM="Odontella Sinensis, Strain Grunow 1884" /NCGR_SAMPLE_ID=MMETSP0160_2 /ASSEMBLY_ACC=CAM_ASM_000250 /LENGTH=181 /DNA_ID=CAMNT_0025484851 /DNA_START=290 /DNA_END=832 /DNA_ORIENTATION=-
MNTVELNTSIPTRGYYMYDTPAPFSFRYSQSQEQDHQGNLIQHCPGTQESGYSRGHHGSSIPHCGKKARCVDTFPTKLHKVLDILEADGLSSVMSWLPSGKAFRLNKQRFSDETAQKYFRMQKLPSFFRQLNIYSFNRTTTMDTKEEIYFHDLFIRDHPQLARLMKRNNAPKKDPCVNQKR